MIVSNRIFKTLIHKKIKNNDFVGQPKYLLVKGKELTLNWTKDKQLHISCDNNNYILDWDESGFSYACPVIFIEKTLFGFIPTRKLIFEGYSKSYLTALRSHKDDLESWYVYTLIAYFDYCDSWEDKQ